MQYNSINFQQVLAVHPWILTVASLVAIWSLVWKGLALWKAGGRQDKWWFIALLLINTVGILEILYLYVFSKDKQEAQ